MKLILFALILLGLFLIFYFSPDITYPNFETCSGTAKLSGDFIKVFYSSNQNKIGLFKSQNLTFMSVINNFEIQTNKTYLVYAKLSEFEKQCWMFPDEVIPLD